MSNDGYVNEGSDPRLLGKVGAWIQRRLSWKAGYEPISVTGNIWPPLLVINIPLYSKKAEKIDSASAPVKPVINARLGWRRDMNWGGYIFSAALKKEERAKFW